MAGAIASPAEIRLAYRHLYKASLLAVQYALPARYCVRSTMRHAFRDYPASDFNRERIANTLQFVNDAAKYKSIAHRIIKNLMHVRWWQWQNNKASWKSRGSTPVAYQSEAGQLGYKNLQRTIDMLNQTMGLCLR